MCTTKFFWEIFDLSLNIFCEKCSILFILMQLRMEMGNVPKRQQPDHRVDNSRRSPTGLQCNEKYFYLDLFDDELTN